MSEKKTKTMHIRIDREFETAMDDIRRMMSPIPPASVVVRTSVIKLRDELLAKEEAKEKRRRTRRRNARGQAQAAA